MNERATSGYAAKSESISLSSLSEAEMATNERATSGYAAKSESISLSSLSEAEMK